MEDGGRIVNITTSLVAFTNPGYGVAAYSGSKAALENFTKVSAGGVVTTLLSKTLLMSRLN